MGEQRASSARLREDGPSRGVYSGAALAVCTIGMTVGLTVLSTSSADVFPASWDWEVEEGVERALDVVCTVSLSLATATAGEEARRRRAPASRGVVRVRRIYRAVRVRKCEARHRDSHPLTPFARNAVRAAPFLARDGRCR